MAFIGQGVFKFIVQFEMETEVKSDVPKNTVTEADDNTDLEQDLTETGLLPTDNEDSSNEDSLDEGNVNDSRENDFDGENVDNRLDAGNIDPLPMDIENTDHSLDNVQEALNSMSTMDTLAEAKTS